MKSFDMPCSPLLKHTSLMHHSSPFWLDGGYCALQGRDGRFDVSRFQSACAHISPCFTVLPLGISSDLC